MVDMPGIGERLGRIEGKLDGLVEDVKPLNDKVNSHAEMWAGLAALQLHERVHNLRTDVDALKTDKARREGANKTWLVVWGGCIAIGGALVQLAFKLLGA